MSLLLLTAAAVCVLVVVVVAAGLVANRLPLGDPPGIGPRLVTYLTRNVAQTAPDPRFPELAPLFLPGDPHDALERIADAFRTLGWEEIALDHEARRVTAVVRSKVFGFRDDLEATVRSSSAGGATVQVRSASRIGRGDLGANTRHVMDLREALEVQKAVGDRVVGDRTRSQSSTRAGDAPRRGK